MAKELQSNRAGTAVLQLKLSLHGVSKPLVWRRLLVPADEFSTASGDYGPPDPELDHRDERGARLSNFLAQPGEQIRYTYDFGDFWEHDIVLEKTLEPDSGARLPV